MSSARRSLLLVVAVCLGSLLLWLWVGTTGALDRLDLTVFDAELAMAPRPRPLPAIAIITIDEKAVHEYGPQPWPPMLMAKLVDRIERFHPRVVGIDFVYTGEGEHKGEAQAETRPGLGQLAEAYKRAGNVVAGTFFDFEEVNTGSRAPDYLGNQRMRQVRYLQGTSPETLNRIPILHARAAHTNTPEVSQAANRTGHLNLLQASDGTIRWMPLVVRYGDDLYASFDVQMASVYAGEDPQIVIDRDGVSSVEAGGRAIETDEAGRMLIRFAIPENTYDVVSAADVMEGTVPADKLRDRLVVVGTSAAATGDAWITAQRLLLPGVKIHAIAIDNLVQGNFLVHDRFTRTLTFEVLIGCTVLGIVLLPRTRRRGLRWMGAMATTMALVLVGGHYFVFTRTGYAIGLLLPLMTSLTSFGGTLAVNYFSEERHRRQIEKSFRYYLDPNVIAQLMENPKRLRLGGERRELTVLFCDIRSFSTMSENLAPETIVSLLNDFFTSISDVVFRSEGLVDKFVGDQVMAFWGAPVPCPNHAALACSAALGIRKQFQRFCAHWSETVTNAAPMPRGFKLNCGIGINSGPMVVGNIGSAKRFSYTVIGDTVNIAARLEALNKTYGTAVLVGPDTYAAARDHFHFRQVDEVRVRGRNQAIPTYELLASREDTVPDPVWLEAFEQGLRAFLRQDWAAACAGFGEALHRNPQDSCASYYAKRVAETMSEAAHTVAAKI